MTAFLEERRSVIGSSDAPAIAGVSRWGGRFEVWRSKVDELTEEELLPGDPRRWGHLLEDTVARAWAEEHGVKVQRFGKMLRHKEFPFLGANPDRRVVGEAALLEVKTIPYAGEEWGDTADEVPPYVKVQATHQLLVTGLERVYIAALFRGTEPRSYVVERNDRAIAALLRMELEFVKAHLAAWAGLGEENVAPPMDGTEAAKAYLAKKFPVDSGAELVATPEQADVIAALVADKRAAKELEASILQKENTIREVMGEATTLLAPGVRVTWKKNADSEVTDWKAVAAAFRNTILAERKAHGIDLEEDLDTLTSVHTNTKPGPRVLRVKEA